MALYIALGESPWEASCSNRGRLTTEFGSGPSRLADGPAGLCGVSETSAQLSYLSYLIVSIWVKGNKERNKLLLLLVVSALALIYFNISWS